MIPVCMILMHLPSNIFTSEEQTEFPKVSLRYYTVSEIINSVINAGFTLKEFIEHPNGKLPAEFTIIAYKKITSR